MISQIVTIQDNSYVTEVIVVMNTPIFLHLMFFCWISYTLLVFETTWHRLGDSGWIANCKGFGKKAGDRHFSGKNEGNHRQPQSRQLMYRPRLKLGTSWDKCNHYCHISLVDPCDDKYYSWRVIRAVDTEAKDKAK